MWSKVQVKIAQWTAVGILIIISVQILEEMFSSEVGYNDVKIDDHLPNHDSLMQYEGPEIHRAAARGELDKIKLKLKQDANLINSLDSQSNTPLHLATRYVHTEVIKFLIANGANINARNEAGDTPLSSTIFFCFRQRKGVVDVNLVKGVVEILISSGADVNTTTRFGYTPMHHAAAWGTKEVVELLISAGADINVKDHNGDTPLNAACRYRPKKKGGVIDLLHKNGAVRRHGKDNSYDYEPDLIGLF
jgi:ankyrin repeat protein